MKELNFKPIPVSVTTPIIIPAVAVASATGRIVQLLKQPQLSSDGGLTDLIGGAAIMLAGK